MIVDSAIYVDGKRTAEPRSLQETYDACRDRHGVAWIGLYKPTAEEFDFVTREFGLHPLAVEDAIKAHQRPKLERYGDSLFVVLNAARYVDETETVEFGEVHVFVGPDYVIVVRHGEAPALREVRAELEAEPSLLSVGPMAILHAVMDRVVDDYVPVVEGLETDIEEIEAEVFGGNSGVSRRVYQLAREVIQFQRATRPLVGMLERLVSSRRDELDPELRRYLRDVHDHALQIVERLEGLHELLSNILSVNLTMVGITQNDEVKKVSAWAAILFAPTLIGTVYGMNFDNMPELHWTFGYPLALALMAMTSVCLFLVFKRRGWL